MYTVLIFTAIIAGIALLSGLSYERFHRAQDRQDLPQIGRAVFIDGRMLNIYCSGAGRPAVIFQSGAPWPLLKEPKTIFENGGPHPGYSWVAIQRQTAQFSRACWYDRAGSGWSDVGPYPRDSASQAHDLHALLLAAAVPPPYVLVAELSAALDARVYSGFYPDEVAGLVLVDGVHPDVFMRTSSGGGRMERLPRFVGHGQDLSAQFFNQIGLLRLGLRDRAAPAPPLEITASEWNTIWRLTRSSKARTALMQDIAAWPQSAAETRAAGKLGNLPLRVISSTNTILQADLAGLSTRGAQVVVDSRPGDLIYQAPDLIVETVRQVLAEAR